MASSPPVSIGMPVYNAANYLAESLGSMLGQDFGDFELIVGDNASTDETLEIAKDIAGRDDRVRVLTSDSNRGAAWNYNRVFRESSGAFFRWQAHDDRADPTMLGRLVAAHAENDVVLAYAWSRWIDENGEPYAELHDALHIESSRPHRRLANMISNLRDCNAVFGLIRRDVLETTHLIAPFHSGDVALLYELALRGRFHEVTEHLFDRRQHPDSSLAANRSTEEINRWFDTSQRRSGLLPGARLFAVHAVNVARAPIPVSDRARCMGVLSLRWPPEYLRRIVRQRRREKLFAEGLSPTAAPPGTAPAP